MRDALIRLLQLVYFVAPAHCAMAPPFAGYWRGWNPPICEYWLGSHKSVVGVVAAIAVTGLQRQVDVPLPLIN